MQSRSVYVLRDPRNGEARYIGFSVNPQKRLQDHCANAGVRRKSHLAKNVWLRELQACSLRPDIQILEVTNDPEAEGRWIRRFLESGANLLNETADGRGGSGRM